MVEQPTAPDTPVGPAADEDPREVARRIVAEVLAAHEPAGTTHDLPAVDGPPTPPEVLDPRPAAAGPAGTSAVADELDDRPSRQVARRIVEEVLAAHAAAQRDLDVPAAAVEAVAVDAPDATAVPVRPAGPDAVTTGPPDAAVDLTAPEVEPTEAAAIARRIVASVLAEADARRADEVERPSPARLPDGDGPPPLPVERDTVDGPGELPAEETVALPVDAAPAVGAEPTSEATAEDTVALPVVDDEHDEEPADVDEGWSATVHAPPPPARPVRAEVSPEVTTPLATAEPEPRRVRWILATVLGAVTLAVLLPLAVGALRDLVALG